MNFMFADHVMNGVAAGNTNGLSYHTYFWLILRIALPYLLKSQSFLVMQVL